MLSKPSPESSVGKFWSARKSTASRSRIVLVYSARFNRRAVTRPGSGFIAASARVNSFSSNVDQRLDLLVRRRHRRIVRRHLAVLELRQDDLPPVAIGGERVDRPIDADVETAGRVAGVVALAAGVVEQRLGRGGERLRGCGGRAPAREAAGRDGDSRGERARPRRVLARPRAPAPACCSDDLMFTARIKAVDATPTAQRMTSSLRAPRPSARPWSRLGRNHRGVHANDPFLLCRVDDQIPMLALGRGRKPRPPVVEHA